MAKVLDDLDSCPDAAMSYIADMLGAAFRDKMIATMGGTQIKVPVKIKSLSDNHYLVERLGRIDAEELVDLMAGEAFYIPVGVPGAKREAAIAMIRAGKTTAEVVTALTVSDRQVRRWRARAGLDGTSLAAKLGVSVGGLARAIRDNPHLLPDPQ